MEQQKVQQRVFKKVGKKLEKMEKSQVLLEEEP